MSDSNFNPFNNPIPIADWCAMVLEATKEPLIDDVDKLINQIIHINSMYESVFASTPVDAKLKASVRLEFQVSDESFEQLKKLSGESLIFHEPTATSPYNWVKVGGNRDTEYLEIVVYTAPMQVTFKPF